jgi:hypothetical protein
MQESVERGTLTCRWKWAPVCKSRQKACPFTSLRQPVDWLELRSLCEADGFCKGAARPPFGASKHADLPPRSAGSTGWWLGRPNNETWRGPGGLFLMHRDVETDARARRG